VIIINADDWGRSRNETDAAAHCFRHGAVTSVSAMVYMPDSERAAELAADLGVDVGLHVNLTEPLCRYRSGERLRKCHQRVAAYLTFNKYAGILYNPALHAAFRDVCEWQMDEFVRLYGRRPSHIDGHHHQHLCMNLLLAAAFPKGTKVRRSFHFSSGERSVPNRAYRAVVDMLLARRYRVVDYFFALSQCLSGERMDRVCVLAQSATVELMTHPANAAEAHYLMSDEYKVRTTGLQKATYAML
jgi:predicted glycoside hydrolase/deacetylase ChbG (UPF0249 family)